MNIIKQKIESAIQQEMSRQRAWDLRNEEFNKSVERSKESSREWKCTLRTATPDDYKEWLFKYLSNGGQITHVYSYLMPNSFYIATKDIHVTPLHGSQAINIIIPEGIRVTSEDLGHNSLYFMSLLRRPGWVPLYRDIRMED